MAAPNDDEYERSSLKQVVLEGPDNYNDWFRGITNTLLIKDLFDIAEGTELRPTPEKDEANDAPAFLNRLKPWRKNDRKAYGLINASVSTTVSRSVPACLASYHATAEAANSFLLFEHLKSTYSSGSGPRQAELGMTVFRSDLDVRSGPHAVPIQDQGDDRLSLSVL